MRSLTDFRALLDRLEECVADELEARDLDFKHWNNRSLKLDADTGTARPAGRSRLS